MAWTKVEEIKIRNWTVLVVAEAMKIEEVPEKYRAEIQKRVDNWSTTHSAEQTATE